MAKRSRMSILKRQRELHKAEKAARKRARRHGLQVEGPTEPRPTVTADQLLGRKPLKSDDRADGSAEESAQPPKEETS